MHEVEKQVHSSFEAGHYLTKEEATGTKILPVSGE